MQFNGTYQKTQSPNLSPYFCYKSSREKLLKYQEHSPGMILSLIILMTLGVELQGEILHVQEDITRR